MRKAAEFLASKDIIVQRNLNPERYRIQDTIARKEIMKVIMRAS